MKGLVFPLPFPARDAQPAASEQSGQERALSRPEGTQELSPVQAERCLASVLQGSLWEGRGLSARSFPFRGDAAGICYHGRGSLSLLHGCLGFLSLGEWIRADGRMLAGMVPPQGIVLELSGTSRQGFVLPVESEVTGVPGGSDLIHCFIGQRQLWT